MKFVMCAALAAAVLFAACGDDDNGSSGNNNNPDANTTVVRPGSPASTNPTPAGQATSSLPTESDGNAPGIPALDGEIITTDSGLQYIDQETGDGPSPQPNQAVQVHYTGWLTDGTKFDSSVDRGQPATFPLSGVIPGFREGISTMQAGGKRRLIIPGALGYGARGSGTTIPPNATLIFDVELLAIQ
jgi:peptidylprolyl isomerase